MAEPEYPGVRLTEPAEMLRRVAHGGKCQTADGIPGSEAFKPDRKALRAEPGIAAFRPGGRGSLDNGGLSTKREAESPEAAYWAYLRTANPPGSRWAMGTWGFLVGQSDSLGLPAYDDAGIDAARPENHATVWFPMPPQSELSNAKLRVLHERLADDLRTFAIEHRPLFRPNDPWADARSIQSTSV